MTAIAPQAYPEHIIIIDGRLINADVSAKHIDELREYARDEKFDLEGECFSRYGYGSDWLRLRLAHSQAIGRDVPSHCRAPRRDHHRHPSPLSPLPGLQSQSDAL
jgi:hypothetical protein